MTVAGLYLMRGQDATLGFAFGQKKHPGYKII
jgi:hypothetical protein